MRANTSEYTQEYVCGTFYANTNFTNHLIHIVMTWPGERDSYVPNIVLLQLSYFVFRKPALLKLSKFEKFRAFELELKGTELNGTRFKRQNKILSGTGHYLPGGGGRATMFRKSFAQKSLPSPVSMSKIVTLPHPPRKREKHFGT